MRHKFFSIILLSSSLLIPCNNVFAQDKTGNNNKENTNKIKIIKKNNKKSSEGLIDRIRNSILLEKIRNSIFFNDPNFQLIWEDASFIIPEWFKTEYDVIWPFKFTIGAEYKVLPYLGLGGSIHLARTRRDYLLENNLTKIKYHYSSVRPTFILSFHLPTNLRVSFKYEYAWEKQREKAFQKTIDNDWELIKEARPNVHPNHILKLDCEYAPLGTGGFFPKNRLFFKVDSQYFINDKTFAITTDCSYKTSITLNKKAKKYFEQGGFIFELYGKYTYLHTKRPDIISDLAIDRFNLYNHLSIREHSVYGKTSITYIGPAFTNEIFELDDIRPMFCFYFNTGYGWGEQIKNTNLKANTDLISSFGAEFLIYLLESFKAGFKSSFKFGTNVRELNLECYYSISLE